MTEKAQPQETLAEKLPPFTNRTADELVRYVRRTNTNATINQSLQQLRRLSAEASQTAITKHTLRRHRKGFLVRTTAIVAGMLAVVWAPPLQLWTKNPQLAIWGPLAVFAATCSNWSENWWSCSDWNEKKWWSRSRSRVLPFGVRNCRLPE